jgi:hypothetical protein
MGCISIDIVAKTLSFDLQNFLTLNEFFFQQATSSPPSICCLVLKSVGTYGSNFDQLHALISVTDCILLS